MHALVASGTIDTDTLRSIQANVTLSRAAPVIAALDGAGAETDDGRVVLQLILDWREDLGCGTESRGCAAYETFEYRLSRAAFDDELGAGDGPADLARRYVASELAHEALTRLAAMPADPWWDDITTPDRRETMADAVSRALDQAGGDLRATLGDPAGWTWGRIHTVTFREQSLGESGIWRSPIISPPSTPMTLPVIQWRRGEASATSASPTSSGRVNRPPGLRSSAASQFLVAGNAAQRGRVGHAGADALTVMPCGMSSSASWRTCASSAALAALTGP
jgi:acyl-homoserine lactone acylase PvdQ